MQEWMTTPNKLALPRIKLSIDFIKSQKKSFNQQYWDQIDAVWESTPSQ